MSTATAPGAVCDRIPSHVYVVAAFGTRYDGMLLTLVSSLYRALPETELLVVHQDTDEFIEVLGQGFRAVTFVRTEFKFAADPTQRISSKVLMWAEAHRHLRRLSQNEGKMAIFLDVDTLVMADPRPALWRACAANADLIVTDKPEDRWPLNSGVMGVRLSARGGRFFDAWVERTQCILASPSLVQEAADRRAPYGGADQMSLHQLVGYTRNATTLRAAYDPDVTVSIVPCARFNETKSRALDDETYIVHFKGAWQPVLLEGKRFPKSRPMERSWQMYETYLAAYVDATRLLQSRTGWRPSGAFKGIRVPRYVREKSRLRRAIFLMAHTAHNLARDAAQLPRRTTRFVRRRWSHSRRPLA